MLTTTKPKTPLPWRISLPEGETSFQVVTDDTCWTAAAGCCSTDAEYIIQAANAYPRLVAALEAACELSAMQWEDDPENEPAPMQNARDLLRELEGGGFCTAETSEKGGHG